MQHIPTFLKTMIINHYKIFNFPFALTQRMLLKNKMNLTNVAVGVEEEIGVGEEVETVVVDVDELKRK